MKKLIFTCLIVFISFIHSKAQTTFDPNYVLISNQTEVAHEVNIEAGVGCELLAYWSGTVSPSTDIVVMLTNISGQELPETNGILWASASALCNLEQSAIVSTGTDCVAKPNQIGHADCLEDYYIKGKYIDFSGNGSLGRAVKITQ